MVDAFEAPLNVTVAPLPFAAGVIVPEMLQVCACTMVTVAPTALLESVLPPPELATLPLTATAEDVFVVELAIVSVTVASTPFEIAVEFVPSTIHVRLPVRDPHTSDLLAALAAAPIADVIAEKSDVE